MKKFQKMISAVTAAVMTCSMAAVGSVFSSTASAADKTAIDIVNEMGMGWNLGNTFDCSGGSETYFGLGWVADENGNMGTGWIDKASWNANSTETMWGNPITTKAMIDAVHAEGFDSIRIPVTWFENSDPETYDIDDAYLARVKEVVDYAYDNGMYVIVNMHWDCSGGNNSKYWLDAGMSALPRYKTMWTEIANYFKDYDNHLVLESMNEVPFDYTTLNTFNQTFVDVVRGTGSGNADRLLLLAGANDDLTKTCNPEYKLPDDKMIAVSIHYYYPSIFAVATKDSTWGYTDKWGTDSEKQNVYDLFAKMKAYYADEGIPVILGEYGVVTNENGGKDHDSIVSYLDTIASSALATDGVTAFLWDAGNAGDMQYFDRKNLTWFNQDYADVYKNLRENGTSLEFEYNITKTTETSSSATVTLSGDPDYSIDLAPYAGKGITIKQVILKGEAGGGWGLSLPATNPDGSNRSWTSEAGQTGADGTVTIDIDGIFEGDNGSEEYVLSLAGNIGISHWWGDGQTLESVTLVFDKEITYTSMDVSVTAKQKEQTATEPVTEEETTEPVTEEVTETTEETTEAPEETTEAPEETSEASGLTVTKYGDADGSGEVDILDVITVNKTILGKEDLSEQGLVNIDFNKNGRPDSEEALAIMKRIVSLLTDEDLANFKK
ncbi:MAG: cellulase family glycosylhydrolase [Oscillospiraceae bacterium]|nr:cellulase family glycosylhydrolase [Oscillospiraceae bacterium]